MMANPLEEFKDVPYGRWAALGHKLGGLKAIEVILKDDELARRIRKQIADVNVTTIILSDERTRFYKEVFGLTVDLSKVRLPPETEGFGWTLTIAKELGDKPLATVMAACRKLFKGNVWQYADDLDNSVPTNDRDPRRDGSYIIRVRDRVEADEENKNLSADTVKSRNMVTLTLLERIVLELFCFWKTGKHLDIQNTTLCSGSRNFDGGVPGCCLRGGEFEVCWRGSSSCRGALRAREAVLT
ncbi:MAG: hypothetical protein COU29_02230 [Candidatus Magasanikbacteria bacterium CG10_big_fil_rev_8_21_14_0_10_36_32]|uniref:Uncharacterized protein n=1 Tax=Candidatus Magasanikbacteria bacterium CG10_big_fil_rev_8_21_14_0_10_36_32 TaxID=1974646 RepID=A0A2M6W723_9BACT|nr:MAG: hypothetical protein COU29_02230 [Candidatus Magasanikbacteria bacterium CG10_big_fil_rev_8_21_14_0_10_36_32]